MCDACWADYGYAQIDTPAVREVAALIRQLYEDECEITGGMLHIQLDDWNIDDCFFEGEVFEPYLIELHERQPLQVERDIVERMRVMTEDERASALALAEDRW
jgi:hypothetical protein